MFKRQEEQPPLKPSLTELLIKKIQTEYIDLPFYKKTFLSFEGMQRAKSYVESLQKYQNNKADENILFGQISKDVNSFKEGKLGTSKRLRLILALGLGEYVGISKKEIERCANDKLSTYAGRYELLVAQVAIELIRKNQREGFKVEPPPAVFQRH